MNDTDSFSEATFRAYAPHRALWHGYFAGREVHSIKRIEIQEIAMWLPRLPVGFTKQGYTPAEAIEMAKSGHDLKPISNVLFNNYQRQINGLLAYAEKLGFHDKNLSTLIEQRNTKKKDGRPSRLPFTIADMSAMFNSAYLASLGKGSRRTTFEARFWIPIIAAFSGARMDEICQLKVSDIMYDEGAGCYYMNIAGGDELASDGRARKIKNTNSVRPIPIHPTLIEIGFINYLKSMKGLGSEASLFKLERGSDDKFGGTVSKWFSRKGRSAGFIESCGIASKGTYANNKEWSKCFHSFRHTVIDNLREESKRLPDGTRISESDRALVVGHIDKKESSLETTHYGQGVSYMKLRMDVISQISYPGVDFDAIKWPTVVQA